MSRGYITSDNVIVVSGHGSVDYAVTFSEKFPTDRADMDAIAQRVNALGVQVFENNVNPGEMSSFTYDANQWNPNAGSIELKVGTALNELECTLLATQTASHAGVTKNENFSSYSRNSSSSSIQNSVVSNNRLSLANTVQTQSSVHATSIIQNSKNRSSSTVSENSCKSDDEISNVANTGPNFRKSKKIVDESIFESSLIAMGGGAQKKQVEGAEDFFEIDSVSDGEIESDSTDESGNANVINGNSWIGSNSIYKPPVTQNSEGRISLAESEDFCETHSDSDGEMSSIINAAHNPCESKKIMGKSTFESSLIAMSGGTPKKQVEGAENFFEIDSISDGEVESDSDDESENTNIINGNNGIRSNSLFNGGISMGASNNQKVEANPGIFESEDLRNKPLRILLTAKRVASSFNENGDDI